MFIQELEGGRDTSSYMKLWKRSKTCVIIEIKRHIGKLNVDPRNIEYPEDEIRVYKITKYSGMCVYIKTYMNNKVKHRKNKIKFENLKD